MFPAMSRKESSLSLSTVSALALAALLGHLWLPGEEPPPSAFPLGEVLEVETAELLFEAPAIDAGRAFERQQSPTTEAASPPETSNMLPSDGGIDEELRDHWARALLQMPSRAKAYSVTTFTVISVLVFLSALGLTASLADLREAIAEEQEKQQEQAGTPRATPASSWPLNALFLLVVVISIATAAGHLAAAGAATLSKSSVPLSEAELRNLLHAHSSSGVGDAVVAVSLAVWVLFAVRTAVIDARELALQLDEDVCSKACKTPTTSAVDVRRILEKILHWAGAVVTVAAACFAAAVWIAGSHASAPAAASMASEVELARSAARSFRWAPSNEATIFILLAATVFGMSAARLDMQEEAKRHEHQLKAQALRVAK